MSNEARELVERLESLTYSFDGRERMRREVLPLLESWLAALRQQPAPGEAEEAAKWHKYEAAGQRNQAKHYRSSGNDKTNQEHAALHDKQAHYHDLAARALRQPQVTEEMITRAAWAITNSMRIQFKGVPSHAPNSWTAEGQELDMTELARAALAAAINGKGE